MQSRLRNAVGSVHCTVLSEFQTLHGRCRLFGECLVQSEPIERRKKAFLSALPRLWRFVTRPPLLPSWTSLNIPLRPFLALSCVVFDQ